MQPKVVTKGNHLYSMRATLAFGEMLKGKIVNLTIYWQLIQFSIFEMQIIVDKHSKRAQFTWQRSFRYNFLHKCHCPEGLIFEV